MISDHKVTKIYSIIDKFFKENGITPSVYRYNGNIGAMKWKAGDKTTERGYRFTYDGLDRLVSASYCKGMSLATKTGRFNEAVTAYDKAGNIFTLHRQGKLDSGYEMMDNLTYTYTGNKLTRVTDAVTTPITYSNALHFVDRANVANEYTYDANGNITKDLNKDITPITYNSLNLPVHHLRRWKSPHVYVANNPVRFVSIEYSAILIILMK